MAFFDRFFRPFQDSDRYSNLLECTMSDIKRVVWLERCGMIDMHVMKRSNDA
jgi:hypothetical protein